MNGWPGSLGYWFCMTIPSQMRSTCRASSGVLGTKRTSNGSNRGGGRTGGGVNRPRSAGLDQGGGGRVLRSWATKKKGIPDTPWDCHRTADQLGWAMRGQLIGIYGIHGVVGNGGCMQYPNTTRRRDCQPGLPNSIGGG